MTDEEKKARRTKQKVEATKRAREKKKAAGLKRFFFWATDEQFEQVKQYLASLEAT